jgi:YidC/Oxa1 family membrane protein insertase
MDTAIQHPPHIDSIIKLHMQASNVYGVLWLLLPWTGTQIESSMAVQSLKPRIDMMKARYGDDQTKIKRETEILYKQAGVNPLAGT